MRAPAGATAVLLLADGRALWGRGYGAAGHAVGEVCFNTAMTGYQEVMTDPSYARQIVTFTAPHIGNVGANWEDVEANRRVRQRRKEAEEASFDDSTFGLYSVFVLHSISLCVE